MRVICHQCLCCVASNKMTYQPGLPENLRVFLRCETSSAKREHSQMIQNNWSPYHQRAFLSGPQFSFHIYQLFLSLRNRTCTIVILNQCNSTLQTLSKPHQIDFLWSGHDNLRHTSRFLGRKGNCTDCLFSQIYHQLSAYVLSSNLPFTLFPRIPRFQGNGK